MSETRSGGINDNGDVYVSPKGHLSLKPGGKKPTNYGEPAPGIFFHEALEHTLPGIPNASIMNKLFNNNWRPDGSGSYEINGHFGSLDYYKSWGLKIRWPK